MLCFCFCCVTILCGFGLRKSDSMRVTTVLVARAMMPWCATLMTVFYTAGVDGVHLSAGAEDGNSGQCQVERCPDRLYR